MIAIRERAASAALYRFVGKYRRAFFPRIGPLVFLQHPKKREERLILRYFNQIDFPVA